VIRIEHLRLHLPAGFEHRAVTIARLVGDLLARQSVSQDKVLESVSIEPQRLIGNPPDEEIARLIARQIVAAYEGVQA
jgi:hypothetical protein